MFARTSLSLLGQVVQLGHDGRACPHPASKTSRIVVTHTNGVHELRVRFCECLDENDLFHYEWVQLMRRGWFPASTSRPETAFTFQMLDTFHEINFQGKTSLYDFWKSLERITDNSGARPPIVCPFVSMPPFQDSDVIAQS